jgi:phage-related protein
MQRLFLADDERTIELNNVVDFAGLDAPQFDVSRSRGYGQDGATLNIVTLQERAFSISFDVRGQSYEDAAEQRRQLSAFFGTKKPKRFIYQRGSRRLFLENVYMAGAPYETGGKERHVLSGILQMVALNPYLQRDIDSPSVALVAALFEIPDTGLEFVEAGIELSTVQDGVTIVNNGSVPSPAVIRLHGPATSPQITNSTTGQTVAITKTVQEGETLEIDTKRGTVEIIDTEGVRNNAFNYISDDPGKFEFIELAPGTNTIAFSVSGGSVGYLEVGGYEYHTGI